MAKQEAEWSNRLSIFWLKKHGYLNRECSYQSGGISWTYGLNESKSSIGFTVKKDNWGTPYEQAYIELRYTHTSNWTGEISNMDFRVYLAITPCKYGGVRYWFICPLTKNGQYCGRRVGVLFSIGKWYGCRHCGDIAYQSQMRGGRWRGSSITLPDLEKAEADIKRHYYRGRPTRKYKRYIRMSEKFESSFTLMALSIDKALARKYGLK